MIKASKIKLILFLVQLPPPIHGSSSISKLLLESKLINSAFDIRAIPLNFARGMSDLGSFSVIKVLKTISYIFRILWTLISFRPSLVYFTLSPIGLSFYRDIIFVMLLKLSSSKIVYHLHVKGVKEESTRSRIKRQLYRWVFKNSYVITLSRTIAHDLIDVYDGNPFIVNNGLSTEIDSEVQPVRAPSTEIVLLYLSNLMRAKGIFVFLEALASLKRNNYRFAARIIGMASDVSIEQVRAYVEKNGLTGFVSVEGPRYGQEKYEALKNADVFVHPTLNDAFPLVILEAMQFGLPVISTIEGAIPEIVDDGVTGILVPKNDSHLLGEKIGFLLSDNDLRREMGQAGRDKFLSRYTSEKMEQNVRDALLKISNSH